MADASSISGYCPVSLSWHINSYAALVYPPLHHLLITPLIVILARYFLRLEAALTPSLIMMSVVPAPLHAVVGFPPSRRTRQHLRRTFDSNDFSVALW